MSDFLRIGLCLLNDGIIEYGLTNGLIVSTRFGRASVPLQMIKFVQLGILVY